MHRVGSESIRLLDRRTLVLGNSDGSSHHMSAESLDEINDDSFVAHFVHKSDTVIEIVPQHDYVRIEAYAARYSSDDHENVLALKVHNSQLPT